MLRAYNDWHIDEWCGAYPGRFIPLALSGFAARCRLRWPRRSTACARRAATRCRGTPRAPLRRARSTTVPSGTPRGRPATTPAPSRCSTSAACPNFMPRSPFSVIPHSMPFSDRDLRGRAAVVADHAEVPEGEDCRSPRAPSAGCRTSSRRPTSSTTTTGHGRAPTSATSCRARCSGSTCRRASSTTPPASGAGTRSAST